MIYHWWGASLSKKALPIARSKLDGTVCKQAAYPCLSWSAVAMCALTWVVFVPGFFYADRLHSGFSTCVNLKCTVYVSNSSIWPHTNTRAYTHFLQCSPASVCFAVFFFFSKVGLLETTYAISCIHYTHQKLNLHIVIASGLHIWAEVEC